MTTSTTAAEWRTLARQLADRIAATGTGDTSPWCAAVAETPRHLFVPRFYTQSGNDWTENTQADPHWLETIYSDAPLITALAESRDGQRHVVSSSTKPGLMVRMLQALEFSQGHTVLEIGTGTGYNAALLSHRLGGAAVNSVDIDAELVEAAREHLDQLGYTPTLVAVDGADGLPQHAPYDRVIATCSVRTVPWAWAEQTRVGGLVLVDLKPTLTAGNLVLLRRHDDRLEGNFLAKWAGFMSIRHHRHDSAPRRQPLTPRAEAQPSTTKLPANPQDNLVIWFLAHLDPDGLPPETSFGYILNEPLGAPTAILLTTAEGSWSEISLTDDTGQREVLQAGPRRLWDAIERAHATWQHLGQPGWDRLGLTVTPRHQVIWLDSPDGTVISTV